MMDSEVDAADVICILNFNYQYRPKTKGETTVGNPRSRINAITIDFRRIVRGHVDFIRLGQNTGPW
jgi:hypothetical protein